METFDPRSRYQPFSSYTNPITAKTLIWRYLTFDRFVWMMERSLLYHARLDRLEDRLEGSVTKPYAEHRSKQYPGAAKFINDIQPLLNRRRIYCSYVNCWHSSERESVAMWKIYSRDTSGVAIATTSDLLVKHVKLPSETEHGLLGPVEYFDFETHSMMGPDGCEAIPGFAKRDCFAYEKEVRAMIRINPDKDETTFKISEEYLSDLKARTPLGVTAQVDLKNVIINIRTSPQADQSFIEVVQRVAERAGLGSIVSTSGLLVDPIH